MNLYLVSQTINENYDTYDSFVVAANTPEEARSIHPNGQPIDSKAIRYGDWTAAENTTAKVIGVAVDGTEAGVIFIASFNAG